MSEPRKFNLEDRVTKVSGSSWTGRVVGFYSTRLTPRGYCIESENEPGSVQLYPEAAIRAYRTTVDPSEGTQRQPLLLPSGLSAVEDTARQAAQIAYRVCAETRHVSLGIKASDAILAEFGLLPTSET